MDKGKIQNFIKNGIVLENEPMSKHTSFKTGGPAAFYVIPYDRYELINLIIQLKRDYEKFYITGNGSNLLVSDKGFDGVIIELGNHKNTEFGNYTVTESSEDIIIHAGAGVLLSQIGSICAKIGASGFEALSGIPGCVGGACIMNAGAYEREIKDVLISCEAVDNQGNIISLSNENCGFRYRGSELNDKGYIVLSADYALKKGNSALIQERNEEFKKQRIEKQPLEYPSAGSTFKRPAGNFAGKLINDAGLKGYSIGGAMVSDKHAGFIINYNNASSDDIYKLINYVSTVVYEKTGVLLETEVKLIGEF